MIERIPLDRIDDNPYQTRLVYDDAAIDTLAGSIQSMQPTLPGTLGLIQPPLGRLIFTDPTGGETKIVNPATFPGGALALLAETPNARVQLAAGHSRFRAFQQLEKVSVTWDEMPIDLHYLTDEAMADIAWEENAKRKNISAIERARAIERAIEEFGYTAKQIAERWEMSESALSNTRRLLLLPEAVQALVQAGELQERHARELLPLSQVTNKPQSVVAIAKRAIHEGSSAVDVKYFVERALADQTTVPLTEIANFDNWNGVRLPANCTPVCAACELFKRSRCTAPQSYDAKKEMYARRALQIVSEATSLPTTDQCYMLHDGPSLKAARDQTCPNLAIVQREWFPGEAAINPDPTYKAIYYGCLKGHGCVCRQAAREGEQPADPAAAERYQWIEAQNRMAEEIYEQTRTQFVSYFENMLSVLNDKELALFVTLAKSFSANVEVAYTPDSVAQALAAQVVGLGYNRPDRQAEALLRRAKLYHLSRLNTPIDELKALLLAMESLLKEAAMSNWLRRPWKLNLYIERAHEILKAHPGHQDLRQQLAQLIQQATDQFSQEKKGSS